MDLFERLITILLFLTYGNAQLDSIISFTPAERVALKPVSWEENSECTWKRNGREIAADPNKYEFANRKNELILLSATYEDAGNYTCKLNNLNREENVWIIAQKSSKIEPHVQEYRFDSDSSASMICCSDDSEDIILFEWRRKEGPMPKSYRVNQMTGTITIDPFTVNDVGEYECVVHRQKTKLIQTSWAHYENPAGNPVVCLQGQIDKADSYKSITVIGNVEMWGKPLYYNPQMNELSSEARKSLTTQICQSLQKARKDRSLAKYFPVLCEIFEVHPITEEVLVSVSVRDEHLLHLGYYDTDNQMREFVHGMFHRSYSSEMNYRFRAYTPDVAEELSYQTVFVEGQVFIDGELVEYNDKLSLWENPEFQQLDQQICKHLDLLRSLDSTFSKVMMKCTAYAMDLDSLLVAQLSFFDTDLIAAQLPTEEEKLRLSVKRWFILIPQIDSHIHFSPYVIRPVLFAFGKVEREGEIVLYSRDFMDTRNVNNVDLQENIYNHLNWFLQKHNKFTPYIHTFEVQSYDENTKEFKTRVTDSNKALQQAKMVIRRDYISLLEKDQVQPLSKFQYKIRSFEREYSIEVENAKEARIDITPRAPDAINGVEFENSTILLQSEVIGPQGTVSVKSLRKLCNKVAVRHMYGNHPDYLLRECDVLDFDPETSTITVIVRVAEKTLMCSSADPEDVDLIWTS